MKMSTESNLSKLDHFFTKNYSIIVFIHMKKIQYVLYFVQNLKYESIMAINSDALNSDTKNV